MGVRAKGESERCGACATHAAAVVAAQPRLEASMKRRIHGSPWRAEPAPDPARSQRSANMFPLPEAM